MTKEDIAILLQAAVLIAGSTNPAVGTVAQIVAFAISQAEIVIAENRMTSAEMDEMLANAKADRKLADALWDAMVAEARKMET